jgi:hypothetical protein
MSLKATGTHHAKRCEGPASQGKRVHFWEGRKNVLRSLQKILLERPETRRAADKPKQNKRRPQGGGKDPKQCPGDAQRGWDRESEMGIESGSSVYGSELHSGKYGEDLDYCPKWNNASEKVIIEGSLPI